MLAEQQGHWHTALTLHAHSLASSSGPLPTIENSAPASRSVGFKRSGADAWQALAANGARGLHFGGSAAGVAKCLSRIGCASLVPQFPGLATCKNPAQPEAAVRGYGKSQNGAAAVGRWPQRVWESRDVRQQASQQAVALEMTAWRPCQVCSCKTYHDALFSAHFHSAHSNKITGTNTVFV
jgi:hypothetical protein